MKEMLKEWEKQHKDILKPEIKNKYKKAWEELKEYITKENITIQGVEVLEQEDLIDKMEELEQKYNLGGE